MQKLPIDAVLPKLKGILADFAGAVLVAQPGAGKTTRVPLALLSEPWLAGRKMIMLEPRRLAARSVARYMASLLDEQVGDTVGYRVHLDTCVSKKTRVEIVTEGILTRMLQNDPSLEAVGLIIFDEFHERRWEADLGLALALDCQSVLRQDLKLLVMSATLDTENVASLLGNVPVVESEGRQFPVDTQYVRIPPAKKWENVLVAAVKVALVRHEGDLLIFLPGVREIKTMEKLLSTADITDRVDIRPLYGELSPKQQDEALLPAISGHRKIVLATAIAETSLTVEGVRVVIDSGLMRVPRFSPRTGMSRLETIMVSRFSADQRRGRAGRNGPGWCYRLWSAQEDERLVRCNTPEVLAADLAPLRLELAAWGVTEPEQLKWLDVPPEGAYRQAGELLHALGALDSRQKITAHGRQMSRTGLHPRLAHMLLAAVAHGMGNTAAYLAALLSERDILRGAGGVQDADLRLRLAALAQPGAAAEIDALDRSRIRRLRQEVHVLQHTFSISDKPILSVDDCGILLAFAYPDRIGQNKGGGRFLLRNGRGAVLKGQQPLAREPFIVAAELADEGPDSRIFLAAPLEEKALQQYMADQIEETVEVNWDLGLKAVRAVKYQRLGSLVLAEAVADPAADGEKVLAALLQGIRAEGLKLLPWTVGTRQLKDRMQFLHKLDASWPDMAEQNLLATLETWLAPYVYGVKSAQQLKILKLDKIFMAMLSWEQRQLFEKWAPSHIQVPSGRRVAIDYSDPASPVLSVKLQEMFGAVTTLVIAGGKVPLTVRLLSPAGRPVQVTKDLASFCREGYFAVKKDLKGRYPKHYWPDDPLQAIPTSRVRPKKDGNKP